MRGFAAPTRETARTRGRREMIALGTVAPHVRPNIANRTRTDEESSARTGHGKLRTRRTRPSPGRVHQQRARAGAGGKDEKRQRTDDRAQRQHHGARRNRQTKRRGRGRRRRPQTAGGATTTAQQCRQPLHTQSQQGTQPDGGRAPATPPTRAAGARASPTTDYRCATDANYAEGMGRQVMKCVPVKVLRNKSPIR